jgi:tetratricopeptide (TPR) repeat protein
MKTSTIVFIAVCGTIAVALVYANKSRTTVTVPPPVVNSTPAPAAPATTDNVPSLQVSAPAPAPVGSTPAPVAVAATAMAAAPKPDDSTNAAIRKAVDDLLSAKNGLDKHNLFQSLVKSGQIDAVIAELQQRAAANTTDPEIPTTLGEAILNKVRDIHDKDPGDYNQMGILAMQADQSFNSALKLDPQNWEAQFVKNSSMTYWPANPDVDNQVVANLSKLIDQQATMTPSPQFAQTYVVLGNEYQKIGQPDKALATWQVGLQQFPGDPTLQKKVNGQ